MKTGTISGTMVCSESQYQSIPYRGHIHGSITVMGRQTVCLRCGDMGHQRSTCPHKPAKSYAAATRGDNQEEWQTVGSSRHTPSTTNQVESGQPEVPVRTEEKMSPPPPKTSAEGGREKRKWAPRKTSAEGAGEIRVSIRPLAIQARE